MQHALPLLIFIAGPDPQLKGPKQITLILLEIHPPLTAEKQQCPEHPNPVLIEIYWSHGCPGGNEAVKLLPFPAHIPVAQKLAEGCCGFRQFLAVRQ